MATFIEMDYGMVNPRKIKRKMDRLMPCKVMTACFIVVFVIVVSFAMLNQILLVLQSQLVEISAKAYAVQEPKAPLKINYVTLEEADSSLPELATPLLDDSAIHSVPHSSLYNGHEGIFVPLPAPPTTTIPILHPTTTIPSAPAPTTRVPEETRSSAPLPTFRIKVSTLPITNDLQLRRPISPAPTDTTTPAASVNPNPYLPTVATPTHPMKDDARSEKKYHVIATLVTLVCLSIIMAFIVWVVSQMLNIDLREYSREWLIESIRTLKRAEKTRSRKNLPITRPRIVKRSSRNTVRLLDSDLNPYHSYRQACCPESCILQYQHHHHAHTKPSCPFYLKSIKE